MEVGGMTRSNGLQPAIPARGGDDFEQAGPLNGMVSVGD
jgi:hypothetical protein